jgi:hypothetical protein
MAASTATNTHCNEYAHGHGDEHRDVNRDEHGHANRDEYGDVNGDEHTHTHRDEHSYTDQHGYGDAHCDEHSHTDQHGDADARADVHVHSRGERYRRGQSRRRGDTDSDADAHADRNVDGAPRVVTDGVAANADHGAERHATALMPGRRGPRWPYWLARRPDRARARAARQASRLRRAVRRRR